MLFNFLKETLKDVKYDDKLFSQLSLELADVILSAVKDFGYQRYKLIIKVLFIQKTGQAINVSIPLSVRRRNPSSVVTGCLSLSPVMAPGHVRPGVPGNERIIVLNLCSFTVII